MEGKGPKRKVQGNVWLPAAIEKRRKRTLIGGKKYPGGQFCFVFFYFVAVVQSLSRVQLFVTPWTAAHQASLSVTISQSLLKLMSIESVMPSNHLTLCHPILLLLLIFPNIRVFSIESLHQVAKGLGLQIHIIPSKEYSGLTSFRIDSLGSLLSKRLSSVFSKTILCLLLKSSTLFLSHLVDDLHAYLETLRHRESGQAPPHSSHRRVHHPRSAVLHPREASLWLQKETWLWSWGGLSKEWENNNRLRQQSPNFLAPGADFMKDSFSTGMGGDSFRMIQMHYIYCALYFYSTRYLSAPRGWGPHPGLRESVPRFSRSPSIV